MLNNQRTFFEGLYGENNIDFVKGLIYVYPFGIIGKQNNNSVKLHAHNNLFQIFLIIEGETKLLFDNKEIVIKGPSFITVPKNTDHGFKHLSSLNGWIISLSDNILEHLIKRETDVINAIESFQIIKIEEDEFSDVIYKTMLDCIIEYNSEKKGRLLMLEFIVGKLVVQLSRLPLKNLKTNTSSTILFRRFTQLIHENNNYKKTVDQYATELKISIVHLNRICKSVAKKSSKEIIIDHYITEAQILLSEKEKTVSEVCYILGFEDPSYFSRIFKRKTGITPNEFRKNTIG